MNWFERHLHWTLGLACLLTTVAAFLARLFTPYDVGEWPTVIVAYLLPLLPCAWVLKRKSQSLWWLAAGWLPFVWWLYVILYIFPAAPFIGWVMPLALANRSGQTLRDGQRSAELAKTTPPGDPALASSAGVGSHADLYVVSIVLGLITGGVAVCLLFLGVFGAWSSTSYGYWHLFERVIPDVLGGVGVAMMLIVVSALLLLPEHMYVAKSPVRFMAVVMSALLGVAGGFGLLAGGFAWLMDEADPGHVGKVPSVIIWAAAAVAFGCCAVLAVRARNASRKVIQPSAD